MDKTRTGTEPHLRVMKVGGISQLGSDRNEEEMTKREGGCSSSLKNGTLQCLMIVRKYADTCTSAFAKRNSCVLKGRIERNLQNEKQRALTHLAHLIPVQPKHITHKPQHLAPLVLGGVEVAQVKILHQNPVSKVKHVG